MIVPNLSCEVREWFNTLPAMGGDYAVMHAFVRGVPQSWLRHILVRDAYVRFVCAGTGHTPNKLAGCGLVRLADVPLYADLVPAGAPSRIRLFPRGSDDTSTTTPSLDAEYIRYVYDLCQAAGDTPCPFVRHNLSQVKRRQKPGVVIAGGSVLSEAMLPESKRGQIKVAYIVPAPGALPGANMVNEVRTYALKGPANDLDVFLVVPQNSKEPRRDARILTHAFVESMAPHRLSPNLDCGLCRGPICIGDEHLRCLKHSFHMACALSIDLKESVACPSCLKENCTSSLWADNFSQAVTSTRSTLNICGHRHNCEGAKVTPLVQVTSRVFSSPHHVVAGFDLPLSQILFDGTEVWLTEMAAVCIANRVLIVTPFTMTGTCEYRILKYAERYEVDLLVPGKGVDAAAFKAMSAREPLRGIQGLKWLRDSTLTCMNDDGFSHALDSSWEKFGKSLRASAKVLKALFDGLPPGMVARLMPPTPLGRSCPQSLEERLRCEDQAGNALEEVSAQVDNILGDRERARALDKLLVQHRFSTKTRAIVARSVVGNLIGLTLSELVDLLTFRLVNPGQQSFCHAHLRGTHITALVYTQLWSAEALACRRMSG